MGYLLAAVRAVLIFATYLLFAFAGVFLHALFSPMKEKLFRSLGAATHYLGRCSCLLFNIRVKIVGEWNAKPGSLIVSNHVGSPDIFVLGSCFHTFFVSKQEFRDWPLLGRLIRLGGTIFVDRTRRLQVKSAVEEIKERLESGVSVALFPEAGVTDGTDVAPFKPSHFEAAILARRPVLPVLIRYHDGRTPSIACWHGANFFSHILGLLKNPRLDATVVVFPPIADMEDRGALAEECRRIIREEHQKCRAISGLPGGDRHDML